MIEDIARRWFETEPRTQSPKWDAQPEHLKEIYRSKARSFWENPGKLSRTVDRVTELLRNGR